MWETIKNLFKKYWAWRKERKRKYQEKVARKGKLRANVEMLVTVLILVLFIRVTVVEAFRIPTGSMEGTLLIGDFLLVNKFIYGIRTPDWIGIPFTRIGFSIPYYRFPAFKQPERGDVIVFRYPKDYRLNYIKRCVGLPGDTIEVRNKTVYVNGKVFPDSPELKHTDLRTFPRGRNELGIYPPGAGNRDNFGPIVIPEDYYFMMGDNRDNSSDSRYWGPLPKKLIVGEALIIYFSWDKYVPFYRFFKKIRWSRIGDIIR